MGKDNWLQRQFDHANEVLRSLPDSLKKEVGRVYRTHGDNYPEIEVEPVIKGAEDKIRVHMQENGLLPKEEK